MAEYSANAVQLVPVNQNVLFTDTITGCNRGYVDHREGSGLFTLRGKTNQCRAKYRVIFSANIAVPTGQTVGAISLALSLSGEALGNATAIVTPAAVDEYFNVFVFTDVDVPCGCCLTVSVKNTSTIPINVQNANLGIARLA